MEPEGSLPYLQGPVIGSCLIFRYYNESSSRM